MIQRLLLLMSITALLLNFTRAQDDARRDHAVFQEHKTGFLEEIERQADAYAKRNDAPVKELRVDFTTFKAPTGIDQFTSAWHTPPVSQGLSGMCWCFSTTSFFESEIRRITGREVKLSELYTVYWEYVEKARRFVRERGNSEFGEGSESNAVTRIWQQYGVVPASAYSGLLPGQTVYDHRALYREMNSYLQSVKTNNAWNEDAVLGTIRSILNRYCGQPPASVTVEGRTMSPRDYVTTVLKLKLDDYVEVMSLMEKPYFRMVEYEVPDNWWHSSDYLNVPLDEFMRVLKNAIRKGYTLAIGGDTSEPGLEGHAGLAVIPTFDIPSRYIDENSRQFRFTNRTTTDDHGIHVVGYATSGGQDWFLIKDSGSGSRNNTHKGYYFYNEDYVKLKMMGFTVHKDMVRDLLQKVAAEQAKQ
ncbi:MAG TPA: C1 family peptidase [Geobacteraceae bacterium]